MNKIFRLLFLLSCLPIGANAQGIEPAKEYGDQLQLYAQTNKLQHRERVEKICDGKKSTRIADQIAFELAQRFGQGGNRSYDLDSYLNWIESAELSINLSDYKVVNNYDIEGTTAKETKYAREADKEYVSCRVKVNGNLSFDVYDLICMRDGKVTKVSKYEKIGNKVKVDLSDVMNEYQTLGVSYNYGKKWPIGASVNYSYSWFMIGLDFGISNGKDKLYKHSLEMIDVMNYTKEDTEYTPKFFTTITPSFFMKYFAVGCGFGAMYMEGTKYMAKGSSSTITSTSGNATSTATSEQSSVLDEEVEKVKFMLRPSIKGFVPLNEQWSATVSVGYDYVFGYKDTNGINFGVGIQCALDW